LRNGHFSWIDRTEIRGGADDDEQGRKGLGCLEEVISKLNPHAALFMVDVAQGRNNNGTEDNQKTYTFICSTEDEREQWLRAFGEMIEAYRALPPLSTVQKFRKHLKELYRSELFQILVAGCILANFMCMAAEAQLNPEEGTVTAGTFEQIESAFTCIFIIELALNMFSNLWWDFVKSGWNWFDVFVIATAVISMTGAVDTGGLVHLRLLRAFRVLRFFNRIPSLQKIVVALYASIPAMGNAMALTFMVLAMYSVMAVTFYRNNSDQYFGNFSKALFTLFQFSTGDGWTDVVRAIPLDTDSDTAGAMVFFVSFMIIVSLVLMQVVIAVLLEEFSKIGNESTDQERMTHFDFSRNPLEAYMASMSMANDEDDLKVMIRHLWGAVVTSSGAIVTSSNTTSGEGGSQRKVGSAKRRLRKQRQREDSNGTAIESLVQRHLIQKQNIVKRGGLTWKELKDFLQELDPSRKDEVTEGEIKWVIQMAMYGVGAGKQEFKGEWMSGERLLSLQALHVAAKKWQQYLSMYDEISPVFDKYSPEHTGFVDKAQLTEILTELNDGFPVDKQDVDEIMDQASVVTKGKLSKPAMVVAISMWYSIVDEKEFVREVESMRLTYPLLHNAIVKLPVMPRCVFTEEHWKSLVLKPCLQDAANTIGHKEFSAVVRECLHAYNIKQLNMTLLDKHSSSRELVSLSRAMKFILIRHGALRERHNARLHLGSPGGTGVAGVWGWGGQSPSSGTGLSPTGPGDTGRAFGNGGGVEGGEMGGVMQQLVLMNQNMRALVGRMDVMEEELGTNSFFFSFFHKFI
jgi:voltage-gated sodium channel